MITQIYNIMKSVKSLTPINPCLRAVAKGFGRRRPQAGVIQTTNDIEKNMEEK